MKYEIVLKVITEVEDKGDITRGMMKVVNRLPGFDLKEIHIKELEDQEDKEQHSQEKEEGG